MAISCRLMLLGVIVVVAMSSIIQASYYDPCSYCVTHYELDEKLWELNSFLKSLCVYVKYSASSFPFSYIDSSYFGRKGYDYHDYPKRGYSGNRFYGSPYGKKKRYGKGYHDNDDYKKGYFTKNDYNKDYYHH